MRKWLKFVGAVSPQPITFFQHQQNPNHSQWPVTFSRIYVTYFLLSRKGVLTLALYWLNTRLSPLITLTNNYLASCQLDYPHITYNNLLKSAKHLATQSVLSWNHRSLAINDQYPVATPLAVPIQTDYAAGILGKYLKNTYPEAAGSYPIV